LVFDPAVTGPLDRVTAPPYDVISDTRKRELLATPFNIAKVDLPESDADSVDPESDADSVDPKSHAQSSDERYWRAGALLREWVDRGALVRCASAFHAYEMRVTEGGEERRVRGVVCAMELEEWGGSIIPHERTMPGPIEDRLRLLRATRTHLSPVYGTIAGPCPELADLLDRTSARPPDAETMDEQGVRHRRWTVSPDTPISRWLLEEPLLIADGHHRYTTALAYRDEMRAAAGRGPWDLALTLVVDAGSEHPPVQSFHRVQLHEPAPQLGRTVGTVDEVISALSDDDLVIGLVRATTPGVEFRVVKLAGEPPAVSALHHEILEGLIPIEALRFTPDPHEAVAAVQQGRATAAYLLPATTTERIRAVIERGERLPTKSTYFWPKPQTGMVLMPLDPVGLPTNPRRAVPAS
jgi:uncharacterized protein (DUF1015 family)